MGSERRDAHRWIVNEQVAVATMKLRGRSWQVRVWDESATGCQVKIDKPIAIREGQEVRLFHKENERIYEIRRVEKLAKGMLIGMCYVAEIVHDEQDARISEAFGANVVKIENKKTTFFNTLALLVVVMFVGLIGGGYYVMSGNNEGKIWAGVQEDVVAWVDDQGDVVVEPASVESAPVQDELRLKPVSLKSSLAIRQQEIRDGLSHIKQLTSATVGRRLGMTPNQQTNVRHVLSSASFKLAQDYDPSSEVRMQRWLRLSGVVLAQAQKDVLKILTPSQRLQWQAMSSPKTP